MTPEKRALFESIRANRERVGPVGFDIVEVCPPFDPAGITALLAAEIGAELLYQYSRARRGGPARPALTTTNGASIGLDREG